MDRYVSLLFLMNAAALCGQNPPLSKLEVFTQNVQQANADYETLTPDEKELCNLMGRKIATCCARELKQMNREELIPAEINPDDRLSEIEQAFEAAKSKAALSEERRKYVGKIAYFRLSALWKAKADSVGKKCLCWYFLIQRDPNSEITESLD